MTQATVSSGRYEELVHSLDAGAELIAVACPRLVPLIEGDDPFGETIVQAVREYAVPLREAGVDTVILGCTHYPLIRPILQRIFDVTLVFSAEEHAREVGRDARTQADRERRLPGGTYRPHDGRPSVVPRDGQPLPPAPDRRGGACRAGALARAAA